MVLFDHGGAGARRVVLVSPPPDLTDLVEHFWVQRHWDRNTEWRVVPDAAPHVIVIVERDEARAPSVRIVGARTRAITASVATRRATVGARLRPGVLPIVAGVAAHELTDRAVSWSDIRGRDPLDAETLDRSPVVLVGALARVLRRAAPAADDRGLSPTSADLRTVAELSGALATPTRTLYARVRHDIGLSPKRYLRIERLHRALGLLRTRPEASWADLALASGFADQAHLTREFRDLLGVTPAVWRALGRADSFKTPPEPPR